LRRPFFKLSKMLNNCTIYSIKITGGAIKQSQKMEDNLYTRVVLVKLEKCRDYLIENGIFDSDSFFDFYEMEF